MCTALTEYYRVYEKWPRSWAELRESGLVQVDLHSSDGKLIDPDNKKLDFSGDYRYIAPASEKMPARIMSTIIDRQSGNGNTILHPPKVYRYLFNAQSFGVKNYLPAYDDLPRVKLLACTALLRRGIGTFEDIHGRCPKDWDELIDSGLSAYDRLSINPATGQPFKCDGSPDNLEYKVTGDPELGRQSWLLRAINKDGDPILFL